MRKPNQPPSLLQPKDRTKDRIKKEISKANVSVARTRDSATAHTCLRKIALLAGKLTQRSKSASIINSRTFGTLDLRPLSVLFGR
jgi:hypothetical protein